jgi:dTDP-4-dehydrorhamnose reductase
LGRNWFASRYEWAKQILTLEPNPRQQVARRLLPAATTEFLSPAKRPLISALECVKFKSTFSLQLPDWKQALVLAMQK